MSPFSHHHFSPHPPTPTSQPQALPLDYNFRHVRPLFTPFQVTEGRSQEGWAASLGEGAPDSLTPTCQPRSTGKGHPRQPSNWSIILGASCSGNHLLPLSTSAMAPWKGTRNLPWSPCSSVAEPHSPSPFSVGREPRGRRPYPSSSGAQVPRSTGDEQDTHTERQKHTQTNFI